MALYVVRHGESFGNERRIVQGADFDPGLTQRGREQARCVGEALDHRVGDDVVVHASPARRATETAAIVSEILDAPVEVDGNIAEFDPGILAGRAKSILRAQYPEYLDVWHERGDLDGIPGAETGDEVQARALVFLDRLARSGHDADTVVVAHAGFNRYLVNTARGRERTEPIGHEPTDWSVVTSDLLAGVRVEELSRARVGEVRRLRTPDSEYVLKRTTDADERELAFQEWVSTYTNRKAPTFPDVLAWDVRDGVGIQVLENVGGKHVYGSVRAERRRRLCESVARFSKLLEHTNRQFPLTGLGERIETTVEATTSEAVRVIGRRLLDTDVLSEAGGDRTYVHYDLHRENLLFDGETVTILDLDGFCLAPPTFQPASLFTVGFMLEDVSGFELDEYLTYWPSPLERRRLAVLMLARAFVGLAFFERRRIESGLDASGADIHGRYVQVTERILTDFLDWPVPDCVATHRDYRSES